MDPDLMIDALPALAAAADEFAHFLAPDGSETTPALWKDIHTPGTKPSKLYSRRQTPYNFQKRDFGSQEYIRPRNVLRALLGVRSVNEVPQAEWRPDNILYKANLAEILNTILVVCDNEQWTTAGSDALERLHAAFPYAIATREYSFVTVAYYLDLTAQLTIRRMDASIESEPNFSPHAVVDNLFYDDDEEFRYMDEFGLSRTTEENRTLAFQKIDNVIRELKAPFRNKTGNGAAAANGKLKARYRWDILKVHTLKYCEEQANQLNDLIAEAGGIARILQGLTREVERRRDQKVAEEIRQIRQKSTSTPRTSMAGMAALKQLEESDSEEDSASASPQPQPVEPVGLESGLEPQPESQPEPELQPEPSPLFEPETRSHADVIERDFAPISPAPVQVTAPEVSSADLRTASSYQERQRKRQQGGSQAPRRRFIDPQPNAVFVEWNEHELSQQGDRQSAQTEFRDPRVTPRPKGQRARAEEDEEDEDFPDPTQDEGFQTDNRDMSAANKRRREVTFAPKSRPAPPYSSADPDRSAAGPSNYRSSMATEGRPSPAKRQRLNPGSSLPILNQPAPVNADLPIEGLYDRAKKYARQISAVSGGRRVPQIRRPWTREEEAAFMDLIEEHGGDGISYSTLKGLDEAREEDAQLTHRSAEDLRFKARNMKVTLLMGVGGQENLPKNWEYVMLDKKAMDKLKQKGIPYEQEQQRQRMMYS